MRFARARASARARGVRRAARGARRAACGARVRSGASLAPTASARVRARACGAAGAGGGAVGGGVHLEHVPLGPPRRHLLVIL